MYCIWTEVEKQHTAYRGDVPKVDKHSEFSLKVQAFKIRENERKKKKEKNQGLLFDCLQNLLSIPG